MKACFSSRVKSGRWLISLILLTAACSRASLAAGLATGTGLTALMSEVPLFWAALRAAVVLAWSIPAKALFLAASTLAFSAAFSSAVKLLLLSIAAFLALAALLTAVLASSRGKVKTTLT